MKYEDKEIEWNVGKEEWENVREKIKRDRIEVKKG